MRNAETKCEHDSSNQTEAVPRMYQNQQEIITNVFRQLVTTTHVSYALQQVLHQNCQNSVVGLIGRWREGAAGERKGRAGGSGG